MKKEVQRWQGSFSVNCKENGKTISVDHKKFNKDLKIDGLIKIHAKEFKELENGKESLRHFNLQVSGHKKGETYALVKIVETGYFKSKKDKKEPVFDLSTIILAKCTGSKNYVSYKQASSISYKDSFSTIKEVNNLKKTLTKWYSISMPNLSKNEIADLGVAITDLEITGKTTYPIKEMGSIRGGFGKGLVEAAKKNKDIVALCADLRGSVKMDDFANEFPQRFFEVGICEQNMMGAAAGMTLAGKIPFVGSFATFSPGRNWDQLRVSVCYSDFNVKIVGGHAGLNVGGDGATHQALEDIAITRVLPNLTVIVPCDEEETRQATVAIAKHKGPCYIRLVRENSPVILSKKDKFELGVANVIRDGSDVAIFACGLAVQFALEAADELAKAGIKAAIINMSTIKPLDEKTLLKYAKKCKAVVSCEEHQIHGGLGSAISEVLIQKMPTPQEFVAVQDTFGESASSGYELLKKYGISTSEIVKASKKVIKRK